MKMLARILLVTAIGGAATHAAPSGWLDPNGAGTAGMSMGQMLSEVARIHEQMLTDFRHVQQLQLAARKEKDLIKLNCLNDKLVEMKPEINIAEHAQVDVTVAHDAA